MSYKSQLNAIAYAYSRMQEREWEELSKKYPEQAKELNSKYTYTRVKIKHLKV